MKTIKQFAKTILIVAATGAFLTLGNLGLMAQTTTGIVGYETKSATVTFSEMMAYDAAHPELRTTRKNIPEAEFNHTDFLRAHGIGLQNNASQIQNNTGNTTNKAKQIQTVSPPPVLTFSGQVSTGNMIPPDVFGAVGPNHVLTAHNQDVRITNKLGVQISSVSLDAFWASVTPAGTFDPKEVYDPYSGRYIITALYLSSAGGNGALLMGVSQTNDPTGTWNLFNITVDATNTNWMDFPELGYNMNWIAVGGNLFNVNTGNSNGGVVYVFNKANMYSNTNSQHTVFTLANDFCVTPAMTHSATVNTLFCLETFNGANGQMRMFKITGTPSTPAISAQTTITSTIHWNGSPSTNADFGIQSGTTNKIDCGDDRLTSVCYRNGKLWTAHNAYLPATGTTTRCSSEWWEIDTAASITQNGLIDDATAANFYIYPSVAVNANNDAVIGLTNLGSAIHPSSAYVYRQSTDALNTFQSPYVYKAGLNTYFQTFGGQRNRWGDYTATMVDPVDDQTFWTVTEYAYSTVNIWATYWAKISTCHFPNTPIAINGPTSLCNNNTASFYVSVPPDTATTSFTWTVTGTGWTSVASTVDSILVTPGTGTGTITVVATNGCGSTSPVTLTITISNGLPATPGAITGTTNVCGGSSQNYSISPVTGATSYTWTLPSTWTGTSTTNSISTTVGSVSGVISVIANNGCDSSPASTINVILPAAPTVPSLTDSILCGTSDTLTATGASILNWFNQPSGGTSLDTGTTFITPIITSNTTYYVESQVAGPPVYMTPNDSTIGTGAYWPNTTVRYNIFNVMIPCNLMSVQVYAQGAANRTVTLWNSSHQVLDSVTLFIPNGPSRITLNFPLTVGTGFQLGVTGTANLWRSTSGITFPYNDAGGHVSITGYNGGTNRYYYFYNWELSGNACTSARTPINIIVPGAVPSFTVSQSGATFTFTNTSTNSLSYLWEFGDGNTDTVTNPIHTYTTSGTHIVTLIVHNGACVDSIQDTLFISNVGIFNPTANASLNVFPDPATDHVMVSLSTLVAGNEWKIKIFDILGQLVLTDKLISSNGTSEINLNIASLSKGIYTLKLENNGNKLIRRIVKE